MTLSVGIEYLCSPVHKGIIMFVTCGLRFDKEDQVSWKTECYKSEGIQKGIEALGKHLKHLLIAENLAVRMED